MTESFFRRPQGAMIAASQDRCFRSLSPHFSSDPCCRWPPKSAASTENLLLRHRICCQIHETKSLIFQFCCNTQPISIFLQVHFSEKENKGGTVIWDKKEENQ